MVFMNNKLNCRLCNNKGYIKNKEIKIAEICECVKHLCKCGNKEPYMIYDEKKNSNTRCFCYNYRIKVEQINKLLIKSGLPQKFYFKFLEDYNIKDFNGSYVKELVNINDYLRKYIIEYEETPKQKGILFWSTTKGNGKTLAASIILNELIFNYGYEGKYLKLSSDFFGRLRKSYRFTDEAESEIEYDLIKQYINYDILLIDDFGTERGTEWETEKLYELIDGRYENNKLTFITTNYDLSRIDELAISDRIISRIVEMCYVIKISAQCYRLIMLEKETL